MSDLNIAGEGKIVQPTGDIFEIDGKEVPYSELTPQQVRAFYDTHRNMGSFQKANTQRTQELATERKELEDLKQSYENERQELQTIQQYLNTHPDLANMVNTYVQSHPEEGASQAASQMASPYNRQMEDRLSKMEKMVEASTGRLDEGERVQSRTDAMAHLKDTYKDKFKEEEFNEFFMNKTGDLDQLKDLYNLVYLAHVGSQNLAEAQKQGSGIEQGETGGKIEPVTVVESGPDALDEVVEQFAKEQGVTDY